MDYHDLPSIAPPVSSEDDPEITLRLPISATYAVLRLLHTGPYQQVAGLIRSIQDQLADQVIAMGEAAKAGATQPLSDSETTPPTISTSKH